MSGRGISDLGLPPKQYRVDIHLPDFETMEDALREDALRGKLVEKTGIKFHDADPPYDDPLWLELAAAAEGGDCSSPASATYMRQVRINTCGAIWKLIEESGVNNVAAFTAIPPTWEYPEDNIWDAVHIRGDAMIRGLRYQLCKFGAAGASGWIIAFIHGEHEPISGVFRLHVHGFACGEMINVVNGLRWTPYFKTAKQKSDETPNPVYRRVHITRKPLTDLPRAVSYVLQSYWPAKALLISEDGKRVRARRKSRIKEPYHSYALAFLDLHRIEDLTLMMGLRVTKDGLLQTKPVS